MFTNTQNTELLQKVFWFLKISLISFWTIVQHICITGSHAFTLENIHYKTAISALLLHQKQKKNTEA